jgi:hypothetical protein
MRRTLTIANDEPEEMEAGSQKGGSKPGRGFLLAPGSSRRTRAETRLLLLFCGRCELVGCVDVLLLAFTCWLEAFLHGRLFLSPLPLPHGPPCF